MGVASAVELREIASGKNYRVFSGAYDILVQNPDGSGRPCRAIVAQGTVTVKDLNNVTVVLPDLGNFQWNIQASEIVSGDGVVIW